MGFLFVERVTDLVPGERARGTLVVPSGEAFPVCLVAEAVGQLASWAAVAECDYQRRPVAGLAGRALFHQVPRPGETLDLAVEIKSLDETAVSYRGSACVGGAPILELSSCLGPMLPTAEFDDPETLRRRLERLQNGGETGRAKDYEGLFGSVSVVGGERGRSRRAELRVPDAVELFSDHFPRRPVFPGTLLLDALIGTARGLAAEMLGPELAPRVLARDVKLRRFISPGEVVEMTATVKKESQGQALLALAATVGGKRVGTASVELVTARHGRN